jgi:hypothetical protein
LRNIFDPEAKFYPCVERYLRTEYYSIKYDGHSFLRTFVRVVGWDYLNKPEFSRSCGASVNLYLLGLG